MPNRRRFLLSAATAVTAPSLLLDDQAPSATSLRPAIAALRNRRAEATPISLPEREHRLDRARQLLTQNKIDALVLCTGSSLTYFTGLHWGQSERLFTWVLPARGNPFVVCPVFEEGRVRERMSAQPAALPAASTTAR